MTGRLRVLLLIGATGFAACSLLQPFPTRPADPSAGEADSGPRVAICYNTMHTALDQVQAQAREECGPGTAASPLRTDYYLQHCPLGLPARATFVCMPPK